MQYRDYYAVLGVERNAAAQRIKQAYRRLARQHHPDLNPGDRSAAERFKEIGEAYEVLSNPDRRRRYDQLGANWGQYEREFRTRAARTEAAAGPRVGPFDDFSSFFLHLFGPDSPFGPLKGTPSRASARTSRSRQYRPPAGTPGPRPLEATTVEISLEEASSGALREVRTPDGGRFRVRIPAGIQDGARLKANTPEGHALLVVRIARHPLFRRDGDNLEVEAPVSFGAAALGGEVEVPTLDGSARIRLPAGVSGGTALRVRGRGMPRADGGRGDLVARIRILVPKHLTPEQEDCVRRLSEPEASPRDPERS